MCLAAVHDAVSDLHIGHDEASVSGTVALALVD
jgi:hypothetical protein